MTEYVAPIKDMQFVLKRVVGLDQVNKLPGWEEVTDDVVDAILEEAGKFAGEVLSPLNSQGDKHGAKWKDGVVTTPPGFKDAATNRLTAGRNDHARRARTRTERAAALAQDGTTADADRCSRHW